MYPNKYQYHYLPLLQPWVSAYSSPITHLYKSLLPLLNYYSSCITMSFYTTTFSLYELSICSHFTSKYSPILSCGSDSDEQISNSLIWSVLSLLYYIYIFSSQHQKYLSSQPHKAQNSIRKICIRHGDALNLG